MNQLGSFDYIIVGGGSAGCVLANRLSSRSANRVLLLEAGPDTPPWQEPKEVLASYPGVIYFDPNYTWANSTVIPYPNRNSPQTKFTRYEQARVLGGGSSINGQMALRGRTADYDEWAGLGATGWSWKDVLPYFKKLEHDLDFDGPTNGNEGPIPISRMFHEQWSGFSEAAASAFEESGYSYIDDINAGAIDGYYPVPSANSYRRRVSTAMGYLGPSVRRRTNLTVMTEATVSGLRMSGAKVHGVDFVIGGSAISADAKEVILSAGAIQTPAFLLRAGIGDGEHLKSVGIEATTDLPGVGLNLHEHPMTAVSAYLPEEARLDPPLTRHFQVGLRFSSGLDGCPETDMMINAAQRSGWHPLGYRLGSFSLCLNKPFSRGNVRLLSPDHRIWPEVRLNLCSDTRDIERMKMGFRSLNSLLQQKSLRELIPDPFPTSYSERVRKIGRVNRTNFVLTSILSKLMDSSRWLRRTLTYHVITQGLTLEDLLSDDLALHEYLQNTVTGDWHVCGTCPMGSKNDPLAVTDPQGRVYGVEGLRVADASLMPNIPAANTNIPTIMIAEKISDSILNAD